MKQNFNPKNFNKLNNLRNKVLLEINKRFDFTNKKILEVGCGNGMFSYLLSKQYKNSFVIGIDIVEQYVNYAREMFVLPNLIYDKIDIKELGSVYDSIFMCFSLTELLKNDGIEEILKYLSKNIKKDGYLVLVEEFSDDYTEIHDLLGLKIMEELGYKYLNFKSFEKIVDNSDFDIIYTRTFDNKQKTVDVLGAKTQIYFENKLNEFDGSIKKSSEEIFLKYKDNIIKSGGIRTYGKTRLIVLKKKDNFIKIANEIKENLYLYYSKMSIEKNIMYYTDFNIENLNYVFPVKTFPNKDILKLFNSKGFYFDVSNENEYKLVKEFNNNVFFSDPTNKLKNNSSFRINIPDTNSHFGSDYDGKSYDVFHIHLSNEKNENLQKKLLNFLKKLDYSNTTYLDIGGGYDRLTYLELYRLLIEIRNIVPHKVKILLECGSLWFKNSGYLVCQVEYINTVRNKRFVFVNASRELHAKWSIPKCININQGADDYIICGSTCYENDLFEHVYKCKMNVGDRVIFENIEPYSYSFNMTFNGVKKADVIIDDK